MAEELDDIFGDVEEPEVEEKKSKSKDSDISLDGGQRMAKVIKEREQIFEELDTFFKSDGIKDQNFSVRFYNDKKIIEIRLWQSTTVGMVWNRNYFAIYNTRLRNLLKDSFEGFDFGS